MDPIYPPGKIMKNNNDEEKGENRVNTHLFAGARTSLFGDPVTRK